MFACSPGPFASPQCEYGNVTCGCVNNNWGCGICPAAHPQQGTVCGNTNFECRYGDDTCECTGGLWNCVTPSCPPMGFDIRTCDGLVGFTCGYPALDQTCSCLAGFPIGTCSCPLAAPSDGGACAWPTSPNPCSYDTADCICNGGRWQCQMKACPAAKPAAGSACTQVLSCMYSGTYCACDGVTWSC